MRQRSFFQASHKHNLPFQAFGGMNRQQLHRFAFVLAVGVGQQCDFLQKTAQRRVFAGDGDQFAQVFQRIMAFSRIKIVLHHLFVATVMQNRLQQMIGRETRRLIAPLMNLSRPIAHCLRRSI